MAVMRVITMVISIYKRKSQKNTFLISMLLFGLLNVLLSAFVISEGVYADVKSPDDIYMLSTFLNVRECYNIYAKDEVPSLEPGAYFDYKTVFGNETIYFKPVTCDKDLYYCCFEYQLDKEQQEMVNPPYASIVRAYTNPFSYYPFIIILISIPKKNTNAV